MPASKFNTENNLFFGAYISSISASVAWGAEGGSCQLTLVEDLENDVKTEFPPVGSPVSIKIKEFEFGGILQRWTYKEGLSGRTYDVVIESVAKLLDGIQVILDKFNGTYYSQANPFLPSIAPVFTNNLVNIYNVFAHYEQQFLNNGFLNPDYGGYGSSGVNSNGFPALRALETIEKQSRHVQLEGGPEAFGAQVDFLRYKYQIDFSELKPYIDNNYRLSGPIQSLSSIVQNLCEVAGLDYYVALDIRPQLDELGRSDFSVPLIKEIQIKTINRSFQPSETAVKTFIQEKKNNNTLISSNVGYEFYSPVTHRIAVGGAASRFIVQTIDQSIPLWGKTANNVYLYETSLTRTPTAYSFPTYRLPILLDEYSGNANYRASLFELRMAMGGRETWETFKMFETLFGVEINGFNNLSTCPWIGKFETNQNIIALLLSGRAMGIDFESTSFTSAQKRQITALSEQSGKIYSAVSRVANNFYGQVFLMSIPAYEPGGFANNVKFINDDVQYESAWDIAESAFTSIKPFADVSFYDGDGKLKSGCAWSSDTRFDYSALGSDWAITPDGGVATTKGSVDKDPVWINDFPYAIVRSNAQVLSYDGLTTPDYGLSVLIYLFTGITVPPSAYITAGAQNMQISIPPHVVPPTSFGIPQQSNRYSWGPWFAWSGTSPAKAEVVFDESLRPETFGSLSALDTAAFATITSGLAEGSAHSSGSVEVAGLPEYNVAQRLANEGPYLTNIDMSIDTSGEKTTYRFNTWTPQFGKTTKANVDRLATINKNSIAAVQRIRSEIQKRPLPKIKFEKSDLGDLAERHTRHAPVMFNSAINEILGGL